MEVLPFIEQDKLYRGFDRKLSWDAPANLPVAQTPLKTLICPDWTREGEANSPYLTAYVGVAGLGADAATLPLGDRKAGVFGYDRRTPLSVIEDGTSNTLLILESTKDNGPWARGGPSTVRGLDPNEAPYLGVGRPFGGTHWSENSLFGHGKPVGFTAAMADGSVRNLSHSVAPDLLEALATIAGGESIDKNW